MVKDTVIAVALLVLSFSATLGAGYALQFEALWWSGPVFFWCLMVAMASLFGAIGFFIRRMVGR